MGRNKESAISTKQSFNSERGEKLKLNSSQVSLMLISVFSLRSSEGFHDPNSPLPELLAHLW